MWKDDGFLHDCLYCFAEQRGTDRACLHAGLFDPAADKPIFFILAVKCFTVMCVVPVITLAAAFIHGGTQGWFIRWISTAAVCFPAALILQVFFHRPAGEMGVRENIRIIKKWHVMCHFFISPILFSEAFQAWLFLHRKVCR